SSFHVPQQVPRRAALGYLKAFAKTTAWQPTGIAQTKWPLQQCCPQTRQEIPTTARRKNRRQQRGSPPEAGEYYKPKKAAGSILRPKRPSVRRALATPL